MCFLSSKCFFFTLFTLSKVLISKPTINFFIESYPIRIHLNVNAICEKFFVNVEDDWSIDNYERQWQEGIERIKTKDKSCIVTRVFPTRTIDWYVLYKQNGKIYVYQYFLVAEDYNDVIGDQEFTADNCYDFIPSFDEYQKIHAKNLKLKNGK